MRLEARWTTLAATAAAAAIGIAWLGRGGTLSMPGAVEATPDPVPAVPVAEPADVPRVTAPQAARPAAVTPSPAVAVPPLPFRYMGRWTQDGRLHVMLRRGAESMTIRGTGPIDGLYAVTALDERRMVIVHRPSGASADLPLESRAGPPVMHVPAPPPPPAQAPSSEQAEN